MKEFVIRPRGPARRLPILGFYLTAGFVLAQFLSPGCGGGGGGRGRADAVAVRGKVFGGAPVAGATVSFVDAATAGAIQSVSPIEDLAATTTLQAVTNRDGVFSIEVPAGRYFVLVTPAAADLVHLPGGNFSRQSTLLQGGSTAILNILLSEQPSAAASYVGSSKCLECHLGHATATQTLHFLGFRGLTAAGPQVSPLQDLSRFPNANQGLGYYVDGNPNDNTGSAGDGYGFRLPTANGFNILLGVDGTGYFQALETTDLTTVSEPLYIVLTYGGEGRFRQRYLTRLDKNGLFTSAPASGSYHVLPGQFNETEGDPTRGMEVTVPEWVAYHPERWAAPVVNGGGVGSAPSNVQSFDNDCAGCHFTGMSLTRNADGLFQAHAAADPGGPIDFDGDGSLDDINIGCERCHGPGSEHVVEGKSFIINPDYLAPGRGNMICGQCHNRGSGNGTIAGAGAGGYPSRNNPSTGDIEFVRAGISAVEFFGAADGTGLIPDFGSSGGYFNPINLAIDASASWRDKTGGFGSEFDHSMQHRQEYMDHLRAKHTQNPFHMLTCWDCHDPHERERPAQIGVAVDNNVLCLRCHAGLDDFAGITQEMVDDVENGLVQPAALNQALDQHILFKTFDLVGVSMNLGPDTYASPGGTDGLGRCIICHMPKTARTASWIADDEGFVIRGDIASHTFDNISPFTSRAMAQAGEDPVPNSCVDCHRGIFRGAFPDYRYKK